MVILGLTGSIGMGKSTVAGFFADEGVPVYSADKAAHALYQKAEIAAEIGRLFPQAVTGGAVDRRLLGQALFAGKSAAERQRAVERLEAVIHPYIHAEERKFIAEARAAGAKLAVLDIPLLLESIERDNAQLHGAEKAAAAGRAGGKENAPRADYIAVVSAPAEAQRARVLARPNMSEEKLAALLAQQMSDAEKRARADFIINTAEDMAETRRKVRALIAGLTAKA